MTDPKTGPKTRHCLMVGAGLSGAVIGRMLAAAGHKVTVLDARDPPAEFEDGRSTEPAVVEKSYGDLAAAIGAAHAVVKGDGDMVWSTVLADHANGTLQPLYDGGRIEGLMPGTRLRAVRACGNRPCEGLRLQGARPHGTSHESLVDFHNVPSRCSGSLGHLIDGA